MFLYIIENRLIVMRKYIDKIFLCLFKNLGRFIPYFKRKYTALRKDTIINAINDQINKHLKLFQNLDKFNVGVGLIIISDMNYHKIQYEVLYNNSFNFKVNLIYDDGIIKRTFFIGSECEDGNPVNHFFNHFISNDFDFTELFIALNDTV